MSKLTLSVDDRVVRRAKRYAKQQGTSVSQLVERYLDTVTRPLETAEGADTPVLREIRGILRKGDRDDYRKHLIEKYR